MQTHCLIEPETIPMQPTLAPARRPAVEVHRSTSSDARQDDVFELHGAVQHYGWGDGRSIPALIGVPREPGKTFAELWLGAHPDASAKVRLKQGEVALQRLIEVNPERFLHPEVAGQYAGRLPFLLKVIAAGSPLSVQVHPTQARAQMGFERENAAGLKPDAVTRNYRDANHKPELVVALTDFYALGGFRPTREIAAMLDDTPELQTLAAGFGPEIGAVRHLYSTLMLLPQADVDSLLEALLRRIERARWNRSFAKSDREYWLLRARDCHSHGCHQDRGLFAFLFLNLVHLRPGEGMFLPAGVLHSYLEGAGVELMANSNNVIRGGLTAKHLDVDELLRTVRYDCGELQTLHGQRAGQSHEWIYPVPAREFQLSRIELNGANSYRCAKDHAIEIFLVQEATEPVTLQTAKGTKSFAQGGAVLVTARTAYELRTAGIATVFKATIPLREPAGAGPAAGFGAPSFRGYRPAELAFGTSGLRGLVTDITNLEAYINARGFLDYLFECGDVVPGQTVFVAADLRPSSDGPGRSILRAVARAITDSQLQVGHLGRVPTPALTYYALQQHCPSIMVTGSHIPFDRNGIKFNRPGGEVLKRDEPGILRAIARRRMAEYVRPASDSPFGDDGMFKAGKPQVLPEVCFRARSEYLQRYLDFFPPDALAGQRIVFYEHSAVGRDLLRWLLAALGAEVITMGRSEKFVPVDTEALANDCLQTLQQLADEARRENPNLTAIVSTDGDSDRPLLAGIASDGQVRFFGGDLVGLAAAAALKPDAVVVPISANDAVDRWAATTGVKVVKSKIGSPHVIEAMQEVWARGAKRVVGWEANGGFLTLGDIVEGGRTLKALPTRDAALPLVLALSTVKRDGVSLVELFARLPRRFSQSGLIDNFPPEASKALLRRFAPATSNDGDGSGSKTVSDAVRADLETCFRADDGFGRVTRVETQDGVRVFFDNDDIAHIRPSGNAPQLRVYAVANTQERADEIVALALRERDGIIHRMEAATTARPAMPGFAAQIRKNIALATDLFARGETPELIATVSGSSAAQGFWQEVLDRTRKEFGAVKALSLAEDLPTNQALGLLLLWQRLKPHLHGDRGALASMVFGEGTRSTPFTETDCGQKPAMATFVPAPGDGRPRFRSMVELALHHFVPVQQFLRRSGFNGLVVKWGDEVQIPTRDLSGADPLFHDADIVRFVSLREMNADEAKNKDWVGVDERGFVTGFIPRRPLEQMVALVQRGLLQRRDDRLWGGINLGSIAISGALLDCLLKEFKHEVNNIHARREDRPALDPEFFTALTVATIEDDSEREQAWARAAAESPDVLVLRELQPDLLARLRYVIERFEAREGRKLKLVAMDFGDQFWGDIGQHGKIHDLYMALNEDGPLGEVSRALAGLPPQRDAQGNFVLNSHVAPGVRVTNSVLINATLSGRGSVQRSVLIGTRVLNIRANKAFDVLSTAMELRLESRSGTYKVVSALPIRARAGERITTLFLPSLGHQFFRVREDTDLRNKDANYAVPILGNPLSFRDAHAEMGGLDAQTLECWRHEAESVVLQAHHAD
jgi:phosphomannomutase